jgi:hypothetical protein
MKAHSRSCEAAAACFPAISASSRTSAWSSISRSASISISRANRSRAASTASPLGTHTFSSSPRGSASSPRAPGRVTVVGLTQPTKGYPTVRRGLFPFSLAALPPTSGKEGPGRRPLEWTARPFSFRVKSIPPPQSRPSASERSRRYTTEFGLLGAACFIGRETL